MANLASPASFEKQQAAARTQNFPPWELYRQLPARLTDFEPDVRDLVGLAIHNGKVRLLLDTDGGAIVVRRSP